MGEHGDAGIGGGRERLTPDEVRDHISRTHPDATFSVATAQDGTILVNIDVDDEHAADLVRRFGQRVRVVNGPMSRR